MSKSRDRKTDAAAVATTTTDRGTFTTTAFGRRRVGGAAWSLRRLGWLVQWPFTFFGRRRDRRARFHRSVRSSRP